MSAQYSKDVLPHEVRSRMEEGEALNIVDVREDHEWKAGHIPGAIHIPLGLLSERYTELDRSKAYIVVCRSGGRSGVACEFLESLGFDVANMEGGLLHWDGKLSP